MAAMQKAHVSHTDFASRGKQYLTFTLRGDLYGINILNVKEIIEYGKITAVPRMPACVSGIINLRGSVVPVVDLGARFANTRTQVTPKTCIVIVELEDAGEAVELGVVVDAVNEVVDISAAETEAPPAFGGRIRHDFIESIGKVGDRFVIVLDVQCVLDVDEIADLRSGAEDKGLLAGPSGDTEQAPEAATANGH